MALWSHLTPQNANQSVPIVNLLATDIHLCPVTANQLLMNSQSAKNNLTASRKVVNGPSMTWRNGGVHPPNKMKRINVPAIKIALGTCRTNLLTQITGFHPEINA